MLSRAACNPLFRLHTILSSVPPHGSCLQRSPAAAAAAACAVAVAPPRIQAAAAREARSGCLQSSCRPPCSGWLPRGSAAPVAAAGRARRRAQAAAAPAAAAVCGALRAPAAAAPVAAAHRCYHPSATPLRVPKAAAASRAAAADLALWKASGPPPPAADGGEALALSKAPPVATSPLTGAGAAPAPPASTGATAAQASRASTGRAGGAEPAGSVAAELVGGVAAEPAATSTPEVATSSTPEVATSTPELAASSAPAACKASPPNTAGAVPPRQATAPPGDAAAAAAGAAGAGAQRVLPQRAASSGPASAPGPRPERCVGQPGLPQDNASPSLFSSWLPGQEPAPAPHEDSAPKKRLPYHDGMFRVFWDVDNIAYTMGVYAQVAERLRPLRCAAINLFAGPPAAAGLLAAEAYSSSAYPSSGDRPAGARSTAAVWQPALEQCLEHCPCAAADLIHVQLQI